MNQEYDKNNLTCLFTKDDWDVWERIDRRSSYNKPTRSTLRAHNRMVGLMGLKPTNTRCRMCGRITPKIHTSKCYRCNKSYCVFCLRRNPFVYDDDACSGSYTRVANLSKHEFPTTPLRTIRFMDKVAV